MSVPIADTKMPQCCPQCGRRYPAEFAFCPDDASDLVSEAEASQKERDRQIVGRVRLVAGIVIALVMALGLGAVMFSPAHHASLEAPAAVTGSTPSQISWTRYSNDVLAFQVEHPDGWEVSGPKDTGKATTVSFKAPGAQVRILVDIDSEAPKSVTPLSRFQSIDRQMRARYGAAYQVVKTEEVTVNGKPAVLWTFTLRQADGTTRETMDLSVPHTGNGRSYAVLCSAPSSDFSAWQDAFDRTVRHFYWENS